MNASFHPPFKISSLKEEVLQSLPAYTIQLPLLWPFSLLYLFFPCCTLLGTGPSAVRRAFPLHSMRCWEVFCDAVYEGCIKINGIIHAIRESMMRNVSFQTGRQNHCGLLTVQLVISAISVRWHCIMESPSRWAEAGNSLLTRLSGPKIVSIYSTAK